MSMSMSIKMLIGFSLLTILATISWFSNVAQAQEFVTKGLIGFWTLDKPTIQGDTLKDVLGKNHGKIKGNPKIVPGKINEGLEFNGVDDHVLLPDMGNESFVTVEVWLKANQPFAAIKGLVSTAPDNQWKPGTVHFKLESNEIQVHKNDGVKLRLAAVQNQWYHAAYTSDTKKNELKLYVDGKNVATGQTGATPNNLTSMRIGSEHEGRYFPGILDEVRIYNRILSDAEIEQNFKVKSNSLAVDASGKLTTTWARLKKI